MREKLRPGRPQTKLPKYPTQKEKMGQVVAYLKRTGQVDNQDELARFFGVDGQTVSNWATGQTEVGIMPKKVMAHDFDIPLEWWDQPDVPIEEVAGKGLGKDEAAQNGPPVAPRIEIPFIEEGKLRANPTMGYELRIDDLTLRYARKVPIWREFIKSPGEHCLIEVEGDSMEPRYCDGDVISVNFSQRDPQRLIGKPVAAWVPEIGGGIIKILKEDSSRRFWDLQSVNDAYESLLVPKEQQGFHCFEVEAVVFQKVKGPPKKRAA